MLRTAARGVLGRLGAARSICSSSATWQQTTEESKEEFLKRFAPHAGNLNPPDFPSNFLPKAAEAEGAAPATGLPDKLQFNFFVPHETLCQNEKVDLVLMPATTGDFGVMPGHVPTVAQLRPGVVTVHKELDKSVEKYFVSGGFAFVHPDSTADICAVEAVKVTDLDAEAVRAGLQEYTTKLAALQGKGDDYEAAAAQVGVEVYSAMNAALGQRRRSYSRSRSRDRGHDEPLSPRAAKKPRQRNLRKRRPELDDEMKAQNSRQRELELEAAEEEALAARVEAAVQERVAAAMASEEVALRIAQRLKEERAKLEERVMRQVEMEKKMLLERKRREDAERRQQQEEMERILEENKRKVEEAQRKAAEAAAEQQGLPKPGGGLPKPRRQGLILVDD